jgi:predicted nucleic acid-binding protein
VPRAVAALRQWIRLGRVHAAFNFDAQAMEVVQLLEQYEDLRMDFADACVERLAQTTGLPVFTLDVQDFSVYRIRGKEAIPLISPV